MKRITLKLLEQALISTNWVLFSSFNSPVTLLIPKYGNSALMVQQCFTLERKITKCAKSKVICKLLEPRKSQTTWSCWAGCKQALRVATERRRGRRGEEEPARRLCSERNERNCGKIFVSISVLGARAYALEESFKSSTNLFCLSEL